MVDDADLLDPGSGPKVHCQLRVLFLRPATGVSGQESLSSSEEDESRLSPARGSFGRGELSRDDRVGADLSEGAGNESEAALVE